MDCAPVLYVCGDHWLSERCHIFLFDLQNLTNMAFVGGERERERERYHD
jgi:hypothetical protein